MNSLTKNLADLGNKIQTGAANTKQKASQKAEAMKAKAGEAIASATAKKETVDGDDAASASIPTEIDATTPSMQEDMHSEASAENESATPTKKSFSITEFASKFKQTNEEEEEVSDLLQVLSRLFEVDPKAKKPHEMVESLELQGIQTWRGFLLMAEEDISQLTKKGDVPVSKNAIRMLTYLKQFTLFQINSGFENAKDPNTYTRETFDAYVDDLQLGRKSALSNKEEDDKPSKLTNVRASITGFASKLKPNAEENGSIADILTKAKAKVFHKNNKDGASVSVPGDDASVGASSAAESSSENYPGDVVFENMKKNVDDLASELETTARTVNNKEEVQKLMVPLLSKLKSSQDKFAHMIEARKKKIKDKKDANASSESAEGAEAADASTESSSPNDNNTTNNNTNQHKFKNLLSSAENATKRAFENAEKVARQAAKKAGILDADSNNNNEAAPAPATDKVEATAVANAPPKSSLGYTFQAEESI